MKKFIASLALFICCSITCFAHNYTYFTVYDTNYPSDSFISDNVVYVGGVYYMSNSDGLFYSHDSLSWHYIDGSYLTKIVSDKKRISDKLVVFYNGNLSKSYDGAQFTLMHQFSPDTVVHIEKGLYIAYETIDSVSYLHCSTDGESWFLYVGGQGILDGNFIVDKYADRYIINNINTASGTKSAVIYNDGREVVFDCKYTAYDSLQDIYFFINDDNSVSYGNTADKINIDMPQSDIADASYSDGNIYILCNDGSVYLCPDMKNWQQCDKFYKPVYKNYINNSLREVFSWYDTSKNISGVMIKNTSQSESTYSSIILPEGLKISMYGDAFAVVNGSKSTNLLSSDMVLWHQCDDAAAFSILNGYALRGDFIFADRESEHKLYKPKGDPYEKIGQKGVEVRLDGHYIAFDQPPLIINDRTLVPLRAISESIGAKVGYDASSRKITIEKGGNVITMTVGASEAQITYYDGAEYTAHLNSPSMLVSDRTLVPVRFISEAFNMDVNWEADNKTVWIESR